jgi:UDP-glucose 4-epimerase
MLCGKLKLRGNPAAALTGKGIGEAFNIGNPVELSMNELAQKVIAITESSSQIVHISYEAAYGKGFEDMNRRNANIEKLQSTIDFQIQYELGDIIKDILAYYKEEQKHA